MSGDLIVWNGNNYQKFCFVTLKIFENFIPPVVFLNDHSQTPGLRELLLKRDTLKTFTSLAFQTLNDDEEVFRGKTPQVKRKGEAKTAPLLKLKSRWKGVHWPSKIKKSETTTESGEKPCGKTAYLQ